MNPRGRKQRPIAEINITPFTDVILVLLIIFMVTTPLILQSSIKVNLPHAGNAKAVDNTRLINIVVTEKNLIYLNGTPVTAKELRERISLLQKRDPDLKVVLFSDRLTRFKDIVTVLDALKEVGVRNLNIAAKKETD